MFGLIFLDNRQKTYLFKVILACQSLLTSFFKHYNLSKSFLANMIFTRHLVFGKINFLEVMSIRYKVRYFSQKFLITKITRAILLLVYCVEM